ncbi:MAG: hypothetical protein M3Y21_05235 [Candidatus Eremiobacteraeota bacterium]|nr:hypothetical protein [Candidatus Eremiobacteraeota bacterium]
MPRPSPFVAAVLFCALLASALPAQAGRQIVDLHKLDAYFALFARDSNVPWKPTTVRLDTYSGAPVQFSVYKVDPAAVISAGSNLHPRAIDVRRYRPVAAWTFVPPGGYQFQSNEVSLPLAAREGFFVVQASRAGISEQVWVNRTRIGLLTKESPGGILVYGADLGSGRALNHLRVSFIVSKRFDDRYTDAHGMVRWQSNPRPIFALASWGDSSAFVSFLPQAPLASTIIAVRLDSAVAHGGDEVRIIGFARSRSGSKLRPAEGSAEISVRLGGTLVATSPVRLDRAGAFTTTLQLPPNSRSGEYAVLATVNHTTAGTSLHVDANANGLALQISSGCSAMCNAQTDTPIVVKAVRAGLPVEGARITLNVIRSPHLYINHTPRSIPWGTTSWLNTTVVTNASGEALIAIPHPTDDLASTYGIRANAGGATAATRVTLPTASIALRLHIDDAEQTVGNPLHFDLYAQDVESARPVGKLRAQVRLIHGNSAQEQTITLDSEGHARGSFSSAQIGDNLIVARASADGKDAVDAAEVQVVPQALESAATLANADISIGLNKPVYLSGQRVLANAQATGSVGDALLSLDSAQATIGEISPAGSGHASASFTTTDAPGELAIGAAFVSDGSLGWSSSPLALSAPGRIEPIALTTTRQSFLPGEVATMQIDETRPTSGTLVVRMTQGTPSGSALFETAPVQLAIGGTTTQDTAPRLPSWHPWVDASGSRAPVIAFERRAGKPPQDYSLAEADAKSVYWKVDRIAGERFSVQVPNRAGRYDLSILKIDDDGGVSAAGTEILVQ